jgi:hypothetical protein
MLVLGKHGKKIIKLLENIHFRLKFNKKKLIKSQQKTKKFYLNKKVGSRKKYVVLK